MNVLKISAILLVVFALAGYFLYRNYAEDETKAIYRTVSLQRGDLLASIAANGTVEPEELVDIGAQVAGRILEFGKDVEGKGIDYGSAVVKGTMLARIDDFTYKVEQLLASDNLEQAGAALRKAKAEFELAEAKHYLAATDWERAQKMGETNTISTASFDSYKSAFNISKANLIMCEADVAQRKSEVSEAGNSLSKARQNLSYCVINSPVDGVVIDRRVNIGQTVVSSLNAPSLFLIAKDLRKMQVWVSVNEADIGKIHPGQPVTFTVSAFPNETFTGEVRKIRLNATMTQNIVTYTVEVTTDNSSGRLLPFLTANVKFELNRVDNVLLAPNAALRWMPKSLKQIDPEFRDMFSDAGGSVAKDKPKLKEKDSAKSSDEKVMERSGVVLKNGVLWIRKGEFIRPIKVKVGLSDGIMSEIIGEGIEPEMEVVLREQPKKTVEMVASPFSTQNAMAGKRK
jgi:HlyD family secretion protein